MAELVPSIAGRLAYAAAFTPGLLDPQRAEPTLVSGPNGKAVKKRYAVYRNNVTVSLVNALAETFPATRRIVGEDFFRAMALVHVRQSPPTSPLLFEYGRGFAEFIEGFAPARALPHLADVARIERAWLDAYHAADAAPLAPQALAAVPPEALGAAVFTAHPAARIVRSRFAAVSIFSASRQGRPEPPREAQGPEDALITRPYLEVFVRRLPPGGATFLQDLMAGRPLGEAAQAALDAAEAFDLAGNLAGMLEAGVFTAVNTSEE